MTVTAFRNTAVLDDAIQPLRKYLDDEDVTEVVINQPLEVAVERRGGWTWGREEELTLPRLNILATAAAAFTSQDVTRENPICSTIFPTGERVQIVAPPVAPDGTVSITIRKPSTKAMSMEDFDASGLFAETKVAERGMTDIEHQLLGLLADARHVEFFKLAVRSRLNILISGATGSGKTTFAKGLIQLIPEEERLLTIEDTRELVVPHRNVVHMTYSKDGQGTAKVTAKELLESALRMRPDRILLQELRDGTAFFYLRNVNSGHPGSITTIHAASAELAFDQLTLLVKESEGGADLGRDDIRSLLKILVDVVVQMKKVRGQFRVMEIYYDPAGRHAA
ncbi:P-type DNA transfer ATPase VirB11 (plasmid) [Sphingobium sp. SJ10-10]|uniref:ATPase provides energy for both assembly of type IV secretion complex and secretion of T-DNA complex (VirB11) n=1 Tax=Sphingomonas sp. NS2 TaxID=908605 RepID=A0A0D4ZZ37_9SPHN|nr:MULTISPECIES: P-type DNA transfer ATPase VirB11 [unclassified Sphingobium]AJW29414.1 ATPase provides energy for both assembly of type IV secretion complex and secretion of T-DNA complex (VirB11) [Sphingomonas sp. NS2]AMK26614.1 VirB11 type IV secretion protein [Sphingobium sp. TKS]MEC6699633.1 P-type DNA transfer ATPase VirB11 [Sphingobium sp. SJ10-10]